MRNRVTTNLRTASEERIEAVRVAKEKRTEVTESFQAAREPHEENLEEIRNLRTTTEELELSRMELESSHAQTLEWLESSASELRSDIANLNTRRDSQSKEMITQRTEIDGLQRKISGLTSNIKSPTEENNLKK